MIASKIEKATYKFTLECIYLLDSNFYLQPGGKRISSIYFHNNKGVYFATTSSVCYYCTLAIPLIKTSPTPVYLHSDDLVVSIPTLINWVLSQFGACLCAFLAVSILFRNITIFGHNS